MIEQWKFEKSRSNAPFVTTYQKSTQGISSRFIQPDVHKTTQSQSSDNPIGIETLLYLYHKVWSSQLCYPSLLSTLDELHFNKTLTYTKFYKTDIYEATVTYQKHGYPYGDRFSMTFLIP